MKKSLLFLLMIVSFSLAQTNVTWLKESPKRLSWKDANSFCKKQNAKLPSYQQLQKVWIDNNNSSEIDGFNLSVSYWTSTEAKNNKRGAYPFYFGIGKDDWYYKEDHYGVRCIK